jgi:hypothetical protein
MSLSGYQSGPLLAPVYPISPLPEPAGSDKNAEFADLGALHFRIIDYEGFYDKRTPLRARKSALTAPFSFEDHPENDLHMAGGYQQKITQRKTARIRNWRGDLRCL